MKRTYECMVLLDNREVRQGWDALKENVAGMLTKHGAEIISSKLWEERKLAYPIRQQPRGTYLLVYFNSPTDRLAPINREFNIAETVMRHMVTVCEELPEDIDEPEKDFDVSAIGVEETPAEPAVDEKADEKADDDESEKAEKSEKSENADDSAEKPAEAKTEEPAKEESAKEAE